MDDSIKISRDERQEICLQNWFKNKGKGIIICPTGFGFELNMLEIFLYIPIKGHEAVPVEESQEL